MPYYPNLKQCPWCNMRPKYYDYYPGSGDDKFRNIRCENYACKINPFLYLDHNYLYHNNIKSTKLSIYKIWNDIKYDNSEKENELDFCLPCPWCKANPEFKGNENEAIIHCVYPYCSVKPEFSINFMGVKLKPHLEWKYIEDEYEDKEIFYESILVNGRKFTARRNVGELKNAMIKIWNNREEKK